MIGAKPHCCIPCAVSDAKRVGAKSQPAKTEPAPTSVGAQLKGK